VGTEVTSLVTDPSAWNEKSLIDVRMLPASEFLAANPEMLSEVSSAALHENPLVYWKQTSSSREMARSFFTSISYWIVPGCETMLLQLYDALQSAQTEPARERMYALVIQGGGRISEPITIGIYNHPNEHIVVGTNQNSALLTNISENKCPLPETSSAITVSITPQGGLEI
jgi:hypothetical protein